MVECPLCDYSGTKREVQAHISGKRDSAHRGFSGADFEGYFGGRGTGENGQGKSQTADKSGNESKDTGSHENGSSRPSSPSGNGLPEVRCKKCGREVKYPELMPYKATCPGCGRTIKERDAFEKLEKKADERGKDELAEPAEV